uniref:Uncharacterized protein n=1 Tax=Rhizophora mucronata TaxID=61149 RepID=A0A2P2JY09_RHIMU
MKKTHRAEMVPPHSKLARDLLDLNPEAADADDALYTRLSAISLTPISIQFSIFVRCQAEILAIQLDFFFPIFIVILKTTLCHLYR